MQKTIRIYKHPFAFDVKVTFGTLEEMKANSRYDCWSNLYELRCDFNKDIAKRCGRRAAFIAIGCKNTENGWTGVSISHWEGTYGFREEWFEDEFKQGLFPIAAEWDGKTYIERSKYSGKDKNGVPIVCGTYYEQVDTFRY